jgi:hypothetical protein
MLENIPLRENKTEERQIEEILFRAVNLFEKTGLKEFAEKCDTILKMYVGKKVLTNKDIYYHSK